MISSRGGKAALAAISFGLALLAAEMSLRVAGYWPPLSSEWILTNPERVIDKEVLTVQRDFLDERFYAPFRHSEQRVVVALGDSFTVSFPVARTDAYPVLLETRLKEAFGPVQVMNLGLGDTGSDQQLKLMLTYILPRITPDVVIWQFYANDTYDNVIKPLYRLDNGALVPLRAEDNWMYRRQRFYRSVPLPSVVKESYVFRLLLRSYEQDLESQVPPGVDALDWSHRKIAAATEQMNELGRRHGFAVYYVLVAPESTYLADVEPGSPTNDALEYQQIRRILERQPTFIDGKFEAIDVRGRVEPAIFDDGARDPSVKGTRHFNESGYALLAERVAARLIADGQPTAHSR